MLHLRILQDKRLMTAMSAVEKQTGASFLDIVFKVLAALPELMADINDPAKLIADILALFAPPQVPAPSTTTAVTVA